MVRGQRCVADGAYCRHSPPLPATPYHSLPLLTTPCHSLPLPTTPHHSHSNGPTFPPLSSQCHNLAASGVFGLSGATGAGPAVGAKRERLHKEDLQRSVWLCVSQEDINLATKELRFFRSLLA